MSTKPNDNANEPVDLNESQAQERTDEAKVEKDIADLVQENAELQSKLLRAAADYQNYVRRAHLNTVAARDQQTAEIARDLLTVLDHFETAMAVDVEKISARNLLEGLSIVRDELLRALERHGIKRMTVSRGDEFDPHKHEALLRQPAPDLKANHIVAHLQTGYTLGDKTLRPAKVAVAE